MNSAKIKPLGNRVLIQIEDVETKTASGLFIPQTAQEKTAVGKVITISTELETESAESENPYLNKKFMYDKYAGTPVVGENKEELLILDVTDLIAEIL